MSCSRVAVKKSDELYWAVEKAEDCPDDYMIISNDPKSYIAIRIEPYDPLHPVDVATRRYAEMICNLLNSGVNDGNWVPAEDSPLVPADVRKKLKKDKKKAKKHAAD